MDYLIEIFDGNYVGNLDRSPRKVAKKLRELAAKAED